MKHKLFSTNLLLAPEGGEGGNSSGGQATDSGGDGKQSGSSSGSQSAGKSGGNEAPSTIAGAIQAAVTKVTGKAKTEDDEAGEGAVLLSDGTEKEGDDQGAEGSGTEGQEKDGVDKGTEGDVDLEDSDDESEDEDGDEQADESGDDKAGEETKAEGDTAAVEVDFDKNPPPFHAHPAWKAVRGKLKQTEEEFARVKPLAEHQASVISYCEEHGVTPEMFQEGLTVLAALNNDPFKAKELLEPIYQNLLKATGIELPEDLANDVKSGALSEERAREISELRSRKNLEKARGQLTQEQQTKRLLVDSQKAVSAWVKQKTQTDLAFPRKEKLIIDRFMTLQAAKPITTPQHAVALYEQAYNEVTKDLKQFAPKPTTIKRPLSPGGATNAKGGTGTAKQPSSMAEAVKMAADKYKS